MEIRGISVTCSINVNVIRSSSRLLPNFSKRRHHIDHHSTHNGYPIWNGPYGLSIRNVDF